MNFAQLTLTLCTIFTLNTWAASIDGKIHLPGGEALRLKVVMHPADITQGLSGTKLKDWADDQGMFFLFAWPGPKNFWMPDTYFNLDIFFLDPALKVVAVERHMAAHPGRGEPPAIARTASHFAMYVLEIYSGSALASKIKEGDQLKWASVPTLQDLRVKAQGLQRTQN